MQDLANESFKIIKNLKNKKILDIGCNDGSLLDIFKKKSNYDRYRAHRCRKRGQIKRSSGLSSLYR